MKVKLIATFLGLAALSAASMGSPSSLTMPGLTLAPTGHFTAEINAPVKFDWVPAFTVPPGTHAIVDGFDFSLSGKGGRNGEGMQQNLVMAQVVRAGTTVPIGIPTSTHGDNGQMAAYLGGAEFVLGPGDTLSVMNNLGGSSSFYVLVRGRIIQ